MPLYPPAAMKLPLQLLCYPMQTTGYGKYAAQLAIIKVLHYSAPRDELLWTDLSVGKLSYIIKQFHYGGDGRVKSIASTKVITDFINGFVGFTAADLSAPHLT